MRLTCVIPFHNLRLHRLWPFVVMALCFSLVSVCSATDTSKSTSTPVQDSSAESAVGLKENLGGKAALDLTFRDENGQPVVLRDLVDGPTVLVPIYFRCPNVCNFLQSSLAAALHQSKKLPGDGYRILSISFDETETERHAQRAKKAYFNAVGKPIAADGWRFLTGDLPQIKQFTESIGFGFQRKDNDFLHPVTLAVISPDGTIIRYLHGTQVLSMDLNLAVMEASAGRVSTPIRKMLTFCFSYDPEGRRYVFNILRVSAAGVLLAAGSLLVYLLLSGRRKNKH